MAFSSVVRSLIRSPLLAELESKLTKSQSLNLNGIPRLPKGLIAAAIAQKQDRSLLVITATIEEAGRWAVQLEAMGWSAVHFYPTSDAVPYEPYTPESDIIWGQMQVLAELLKQGAADPDQLNKPDKPSKPMAIVACDRALQVHLPSIEQFKAACLNLSIGQELGLGQLAKQLAEMGYERTNMVDAEGQWSRRGDIVDIFPTSSELPVRLDWFGDQIEKIREFDPATQRTLDAIDAISVTPVSYTAILGDLSDLGDGSNPEAVEKFKELESVSTDLPESEPKTLAVHPKSTASLVDYLPMDCVIAIDEIEQCQAHSDRWYESAAAAYGHLLENLESIDQKDDLAIAPLHRSFSDCLEMVEIFDCLYLSEIAEENKGLNLSCRPIPATPHQFASLAKMIREYRDKYYAVTLVSAQPSRTVALLQEHDCPAQFVPNSRDFPAIEKLNNVSTPVALKYSGLAEMQGFILPTFRLVLVSDREFFGQHALGTPTFVRRRRRAASKQVDINKLSPGDYIVHKHHGIGKFLRLESLTINHETREYLVIKYEDGLLRVAADQVGTLSRFRRTSEGAPRLNKMTGKAWANTKNKVRKAIKKIAIDLLKLYAQRAQQMGFAFPVDMPWQEELEDSFPYQPTPDQLKAIQDVKQDMESDRPMDRLVCGDVGFGKTEVAVRAIFKALTTGKQSALLAPTTILAQQHYHTFQERFAPYPIKVALLNRFKTANERKEIIQKLKTGEIDLVIGTHQILSKEVKFKDLGLLVVDEEQRFGVAQKEKIKTLKTEVDVLTLTATPIPRTLYMSLSGVREMSLIATPPPSRRAIKTHLSRYNDETVRTAIRQELDRGGQIFYVVPRIEGMEQIMTRIREMIPSARLAIAHGQMPESELESTMLAFNSGEADVLICTTIIESGLDIPRVNTIIIEDAQKFGLAQLYQLRGRVGRAGVQAHAWLFYQPKGELTPPAYKRLRAIQEFTHLGSGYQLAMRDMEIRGVGNLLGAEQSGQINVVGFDLYMEMLQEAINEIRGSEIIEVDDTQVDLPITAFIPADYMPDADQKMSAYRAVAAVNSRRELASILEEWRDRYGNVPQPAQQLIKVMELKLVAKKIGFSRIRPEHKQHVVLETKLEEPAWKILQQRLPAHLHSRFVYQPGKVTVRGLAVMPTAKQLDSLIEWFELMQATKTVEIVAVNS
ncbi:transcription-repair coupling factor [Thalassoporum mexicanum PCC 7367]|uniref:transcription-repair coupling factor n=1 Tax=Thalassoporum mexicanum TaxID=3457544 RepID=UPI00029FC36F|nr:transcription-repair coupling factor [Pseudanabaena sp. PCC 7367]AFY70644.1 transcription-repair coupling factor [Pseudanabaena sp. PCC 7367]